MSELERLEKQLRAAQEEVFYCEIINPVNDKEREHNASLVEGIRKAESAISDYFVRNPY